jgi:hypothetical protein
MTTTRPAALVTSASSGKAAALAREDRDEK